jgi:hypothetical protein
VRATNPFNPLLLLAAVGLVTACSATSTKVMKILDDSDYGKMRFSNVLVIAIADNYNRRAQFERTVVSGIRQAGAQATAYYTVVGHNPPVSSSDIMNAVRARNFDAVLFTRVKDATEDIKVKNAAPGAQAARTGDDLFDLARYNYEEYDEPQNIRLSSSVVLVSQLYVPVDRKNIWAVEITSSDRESVDNIVASAAAAIVKQLRRDKLVGPK